MKGLDQIPPEIRKAYVSTVNVYNTKEWSATAMLCRRVLEGIVKHLLPEDERDAPLAQQLRSLGAKVDLAKPLTGLADALRQGGNLGAHFDLTVEPGQEMASKMVDLLEYLIEYLFILPGNVESLRRRVRAEEQVGALP